MPNLLDAPNLIYYFWYTYKSEFPQVFNAFDNNENTTLSLVVGDHQLFGLLFSSALGQRIESAKVRWHDSNPSAVWSLQYSNDATNHSDGTWTPICSVMLSANGYDKAPAQDWQDFPAFTPVTAKALRIYQTNCSGGVIRDCEFEGHSFPLAPTPFNITDTSASATTPNLSGYASFRLEISNDGGVTWATAQTGLTAGQIGTAGNLAPGTGNHKLRFVGLTTDGDELTGAASASFTTYTWPGLINDAIYLAPGLAMRGAFGCDPRVDGGLLVGSQGPECQQCLECQVGEAETIAPWCDASRDSSYGGAYDPLGTFIW